MAITISRNKVTSEFVPRQIPLLNVLKKFRFHIPYKEPNI